MTAHRKSDTSNSKSSTTDRKSDTNGGLKTIVLHLDCRVWAQIAKLAIEENVTINGLAAEALMVYVKYLRKAEVEDEKAEAKAIREVKRREAGTLLEKLRRENREMGRCRGRRRKQSEISSK